MSHFNPSSTAYFFFAAAFVPNDLPANGFVVFFAVEELAAAADFFAAGAFLPVVFF